MLESDAIVIRRLFGDLYSKLRLGRLALYHSSDSARLGQFAAVAILEPNDPEHPKLVEAHQFKTTQLRVVPPTTLEGIERYLGSGMVKGIGPIYAKKLVEKFAQLERV